MRCLIGCGWEAVSVALFLVCHVVIGSETEQVKRTRDFPANGIGTALSYDDATVMCESDVS